MTLTTPLLLACLGMIVMLSATTRAEQRFPRFAVTIIAAISVLSYLFWRFEQSQFFNQSPPLEETWLWIFLVVEFLCFADFLLFLLVMSRTTDRRGEADAHEVRLRSMAAHALPAVDVFIATYNEEWEILEKSIVGAMALEYPNKKVWVLDDGRREWLRRNCQQLGAGYIARPDNKDKKAGNHNHALAKTDAPFIAVFDADFIPQPNFLWRTLGFFDDARVGIVQTPQRFYNSDPMRRNLLIEKIFPDEMQMFFDCIQPSRDAWDGAFYVGSCAVLRREAIEAIGGIVRGTDVEDQPTSVALLGKGYVTRYLKESLSYGLSAESIHALVEQRKRWCRGSLQILFMRNGPLSGNLGLIHRLMFLQTHWIIGVIAPIVFSVGPAALWFFGIRLFPYVDPSEVLIVTLVNFAAVSLTLFWLSNGSWWPLLSQAYQLAMAVQLLPTVVTTLAKPFGRPLLSIVAVTPKGSSARRGGFDAASVVSLGVMAALTVVGMMEAAASSHSVVRHPQEVITALAWTFAALLQIAIASLTCFDLPWPRSEERLAQDIDTVLEANGRMIPAKLIEMSLSGARIAVAPEAIPTMPYEIRLHFGAVEPIASGVRRVDLPSGEMGLQFLSPTPSQRRELILRLFGVPLDHVEADGRSLRTALKQLAVRFSTDVRLTSARPRA